MFHGSDQATDSWVGALPSLQGLASVSLSKIETRLLDSRKTLKNIETILLASKCRFLFRADAVSSSLVSVLDDDCVVYRLARALGLPHLRAVKKKDESVQMLSFALQASAHVGPHPPPSPRLWQWTWMLETCFITAEKGRSSEG